MVLYCFFDIYLPDFKKQSKLTANITQSPLIFLKKLEGSIIFELYNISKLNHYE